MKCAQLSQVMTQGKADEINARKMIINLSLKVIERNAWRLYCGALNRLLRLNN